MASTDLEARIRLEGADKAEQQLGDIADAADKVEEPVEVKVKADTSQAARDIDGILSKADRLGGEPAQILLSSNATQITNEIGDLLVQINDLDATDPTVDIKVEQVHQLQGDLEQLQSKAKELGDTPINLDTTPATTGVDKISDSARGANSALANMIGNSAQDLASVGGVAGSTGVALGQMAEYASDAALAGEGLGSALSSMVAVAGPIAALSLVIGTITNLLSAQQAEAAASAARTEQFGEAMANAGDDAVGLAESLRKNSDELHKFNADAEGFGQSLIEGFAEVGKAIPLVGGLIGDAGQNITDLTKIMNAAGVSVYDFSTSVKNGGRIGDDFNRTLLDAVDSGKITEKQYDALQGAANKYGIEAVKAKEAQQAWNVDAKEANAILQDSQDPLTQHTDLWNTLFSDMRDGTIDTKAAADAINQLSDATGMSQTDVIATAMKHNEEATKAATDATEKAAQAAQDYAQVIASTDWGTSSLDSAVSAWQSLGATQFGLTNIAAGQQAAYDDLNESIRKNGMTFDVATKAGRDNADQIQNLYSSLIPSLSAAFTEAGGNVDKFASNMDTLRSQVFASLDEQTSLTHDQINTVIDQLGVFDGSKYSSQFEMLGVEDANAKLALLNGVIGNLPAEVQQRVTMDVIAGDPQAALGEIQAWAAGNPATVDVNANTTPAQTAADAFVGGVNGSTATATVDANTKPADQKTSSWENTARNTTGMAELDANLNAAARELAAFKVLAALLSPMITVFANPNPAYSTVASLIGYIQGQRPQVPVTAYLAAAPSAGSIANSIGVVRVPVDTYMRTDVRVTGVR